MRKKVTVVLTTIAIITFGFFIYYVSSTEANKESDSIVIDKDGEVVEPLNEDNGNLGHWWIVIIDTKVQMKLI